MIRKVNGSILIGILFTTVLGFLFGVTKLPDEWVSMPPDIRPLFLQLDITGALSWGFFSVILVVFVMDFVDTMGTLLGLGYKAKMLDENGNLPEVEKPMLADALATVIGSLFGTTTTGTYIESATGIEAGGKSGLTAVVTAILFLCALFFAPLFAVIPAYAYGAALIIVGLLMISPVSNLKFDDLAETIPVFITMTLMSFTFNLGIGMTAGFVVYPLTMAVAGRIKTVNFGMWVLFGFSVLFYIFYPY